MHDWKPEIPRVLILLGAIALLDVVLGFHTWAPFLEWARAPLPTAEAIVLVGLLPFARRGVRGRLVLLGLTLLATLLVTLSVGEGIYRHAFRVGFDLRSDLRLLPALAEVIFGGTAFRIPIVAGLITVLAFGLIALPVGAVLALSRRWATPQAAAVAAGGALALALVLLVSGSHAGAGFGRPASALALELLRPAASGDDRVAAALPVLPDPAPVESARDVHLLVVESYGATVFSNEAHRARLEPTYARLSGVLEAEGIGVRSMLLDSPVFGGRSWLADASVVTGIRITDQQGYDSLASRSPRALSRVLSEEGYRTILAAPGTAERDAAWSEVFPYHRYVLLGDFGYAGPVMGFGVVPDQYTLAFVLGQEVLVTPRDPIFVHAVLVSSHTPWHTVPAYVEDWGSLGDGSLWESPGKRTFYQGTLVGGQDSPAYADSIAYVLEVVVGYAIRALDERGLAVVVGDHQPKYPISERGATSSVVAHVLSRDTALLDRFAAMGWSAGLAAQEPDPAVPLETLYGQLLGGLRGSAVSGQSLR